MRCGKVKWSTCECNLYVYAIIKIIIYMKKLLDSDWPRIVQFKCNTSTKSVTLVEKMKHQCKLHIVILDYDWLKDNSKFFKPIISHKMVTKILCGNLEKSFLKWEKMASRKVFRHFLHANFFMFILLISNHTVFLIQNRMISYTNYSII